MAGVDQKALDARIAGRAAVPMNQRLSNDIRSYASAEQVISYLHALGAVSEPKVEALKRVLLEHGAAPPTKSDVMARLNEEFPAHLVAARCQLMKKNAKAKPTLTPLAYTPAGIEGVLEKRVKGAIAAGEFRNYDGATPEAASRFSDVCIFVYECNDAPPSCPRRSYRIQHAPLIYPNVAKQKGHAPSNAIASRF